MTPLQTAVSAVLEDCLRVKAEEKVLVVTDPAKRSIAQALVDAARALKAEVVLIEMSERRTHGAEPPPSVAAAMAASDVIIAPTSKSVTHTRARQAASRNGARAATMATITEEILVRTMVADYSAVRRRSRAVAEVLTRGNEVHVTTATGTDVFLRIEGRQGISDDGDLGAPGSFGNLPAGEGFIAPIEGTSTGRVVFDGSIASLGRLTAPVTVEIDEGFATSFSGGQADDFRRSLEPYGRDAFAVAELGIGTNDAARLSGSTLEDEKVLGTAHIAFGANESFGGALRVPSHQDGVILEPTLEVDDEKLVAGGRLLV